MQRWEEKLGRKAWEGAATLSGGQGRGGGCRKTSGKGGRGEEVGKMKGPGGK